MIIPLASSTPLAWGPQALADPIALLIDHAFLEMKAAQNAMELMTRWPNDWTPGWVESMTSVARDETAHLAQVSRLLIRRGGRLAPARTVQPQPDRHRGKRRIAARGGLGGMIMRCDLATPKQGPGAVGYGAFGPRCAEIGLHLQSMRAKGCVVCPQAGALRQTA